CVERVAIVHLGRGENESAGGEDFARGVGLSGGRRGLRWMGPLDRIRERYDRAILEALVPVPVADSDQRGRIFERYGISGHGVRRFHLEGWRVLLADCA